MWFMPWMLSHGEEAIPSPLPWICSVCKATNRARGEVHAEVAALRLFAERVRGWTEVDGSLAQLVIRESITLDRATLFRPAGSPARPVTVTKDNARELYGAGSVLGEGLTEALSPGGVLAELPKPHIHVVSPDRSAEFHQGWEAGTQAAFSERECLAAERDEARDAVAWLRNKRAGVNATDACSGEWGKCWCDDCEKRRLLKSSGKVWTNHEVFALSLDEVKVYVAADKRSVSDG